MKKNVTITKVSKNSNAQQLSKASNLKISIPY